MNTNHSTLWHVTRGQRLRYGLAIVAMAGAALFLFGAPVVGKYAIDVVVENDFAHAAPPLLRLARQVDGSEPYLAYLWLSALAAVVLTGLAGLCIYARGRLAALASECIVRRVREAMYQRLHHLQARYYDSADTGDLVQRASSDVETLRVFLSSDVVEIGRAIMLFACVVPILFWMDARLAWMALVLMPLLTIASYVFFAGVKQVFQATDEAEGAMTATLQENLTGIRVVRAFARQDYEIEKFAVRNADFRNHHLRLIRLMGVYWGTSHVLSMGQMGIVLFGGAYYVLNGSMTVGTLFAFLTCVSLVTYPLRQLGRVLTDAGKAVVSLGRINEVLAEPEESVEVTPDGVRARGALTIRGLTFAYEPGRPVLHDISLDIAPGETVALVGPPGSGKSTLIRLLLRLYDYEHGSIALDGREICSINRQWLRRQIGVVLQDPFLYSRSVRANLTVGRPGATDVELAAACGEAAIDKWVQSLPDGFEAQVGERGMSLSGGQRQRLALARALLKDPPVLVLDDALSAVDTGTEAHILAALRRRKGRQTTLIVAHRLSSVRHADRIVVLSEGRIAQIGDHPTLAAAPGPYRRLCEIQSALDESIRRDSAATADAAEPARRRRDQLGEHHG